MYRQCLDVNPEHSYALYNLAVLKEETTKNGDYSEVGCHGVRYCPTYVHHPFAKYAELLRHKPPLPSFNETERARKSTA